MFGNSCIFQRLLFHENGKDLFPKALLNCSNKRFVAKISKTEVRTTKQKNNRIVISLLFFAQKTNRGLEIETLVLKTIHDLASEETEVSFKNSLIFQNMPKLLSLITVNCFYFLIPTCKTDCFSFKILLIIYLACPRRWVLKNLKKQMFRFFSSIFSMTYCTSRFFFFITFLRKKNHQVSYGHTTLDIPHPIRTVKSSCFCFSDFATTCAISV